MTGTHIEGSVAFDELTRAVKASGIACGVPSHAFPDGCYSSFGGDRSTASARPSAAAAASSGERAELFVTAQAFLVDGAAFAMPDQAAVAVRRKSAGAIDVKACPLTESGRVVDAIASLQRRLKPSLSERLLV